MRRVRWLFWTVVLVLLSNALQWSLVRVAMRQRTSETIRIMEEGTRAMGEAQVVLDEMRSHLGACRSVKRRGKR